MRELIPIFALSIPLMAVFGKAVVQPILNAILKHQQLQQSADSSALERRLAETEERLNATERTLRRVLEEQDFQGKLLARRVDDPRTTMREAFEAPARIHDGG
jgi:hypothetical protein